MLDVFFRYFTTGDGVGFWAVNNIFNKDEFKRYGYLRNSAVHNSAIPIHDIFQIVA